MIEDHSIIKKKQLFQPKNIVYLGSIDFIEKIKQIPILK